MRNWLAPLISLVVFAGLLFLVLWGPEPREETLEEDPDQERVIDVALVEVSRAVIDVGEERLVLYPLDSGEEESLWRIAEPLEVPVDQMKVRSLLRNVSQLRPFRTITDAPESLAEFGLDQPSGRASLEMKDGSTNTLLLGNPSPVQEGQSPRYYGMVEGKESVFLLSAYLVEALSWGVEDLRRREIMMLPGTEDIQGITITQSHEVTTIRRGEERPGRLPADWELETPFRVPAQDQKVRDLLGGLHTLKVEEYVEDWPQDISAYGLDQPSMRISVLSRKEGQLSEQALLVGLMADSQAHTLYVMREDEPFVYKVKTGELVTLPLDAYDLARGRPLQGATSQATLEIRWESPEHRGQLRRTNRDGVFTRSQWDLSLNGLTSQITGDNRLEDLLGLLRGLEAVNILPLEEETDLAGFGLLDPPGPQDTMLWVTLADRPVASRPDEPLEEKEALLAIGTSVEGSRYLYFLLDDYPAVFMVDQRQVEAILEKLAELAED